MLQYVFQRVRLNHEPYDKTCKNPPGKDTFHDFFYWKKILQPCGSQDPIGIGVH